MRIPSPSNHGLVDHLRLKKCRKAKPCSRFRGLSIEELECRRLLFFHDTGLGGLACELAGENGRLVYQAAAQRTSDLSPAGEQLPVVFRDAVRAALGDSIGDTADNVRVHWNATLTDSLGPIDLGTADGQTFGYDVYIKDGRGTHVFDRDRTELLIHELKHVLQFEQYASSLSLFGYHYFKGHCQAGFSYAGNDLEEDAYGFAADNFDAVWEKLWPSPTFEVSGVDAQFDNETQQFSWNVSGRLESVIVLLEKNGSSIDVYNRQFAGMSGARESITHSGSENFDAAGAGTYFLTLEAVTDHPDGPRTVIYDNNPIEFEVKDDDNDKPAISSGPTGTIFDSSPRVFSWSVADPSGVTTSVNVFDQGRDCDSDKQLSRFHSTAASGTFDLATYGEGYFWLCVDATDLDQDSPGDSETVNARRRVRVIDDDKLPPNIAFTVGGAPLVGTNRRESHGVRNAIGWTVTDASGIAEVNASLWRNGQFLGVFQKAATDEMLLDPYGLGEFRVELSVRDADADGWFGDPLLAVGTAHLTVTNDAPTAFAGGPYLLEEGRLLQLSGQGSDADPGDSNLLVYAWDLDNDGQFDDASGAQPTISWDQWVAASVADDGTYPIRVRVTDPFAATGLASATVTVLNAPPQVESISSAPDIDENSELIVTGAFMDPSPTDTHEVLVFWGDGTSSLAAVNSLARTFTAIHHFADDTPSGTAIDEYLLRVEVRDDEGAINPPNSRTVTVATSRVGGIELPNFYSSLPLGVTGLLESAHIVADPLPIATSEATAQAFAHVHKIDYPPVGPFDLLEAYTSSTSVEGNHTHDFDIAPQSRPFSGTELSSYFQGNPNATCPFAPGTTELACPLAPTTTTLITALPTNAQHEHGTGNVSFTTNTTFTYRPVPPPLVTGNQVGNSGFESHGSSNIPTGWSFWTGNPRWESYGGSGWPTQSQSCGNPCGSVFLWGGTAAKSQILRSFAIPSNLHAAVARGDLLIDLSAYMGGFSSQNDYADIQLAWSTSGAAGSWNELSVMNGPSAADRGNQTGLLFRQSQVNVPTAARFIEVNLRMYRDGATGNDGYLDNIDLRFRDRSLLTTPNISRTGTDRYILPRFDSSLGILQSANVSLDAQADKTDSTNSGQVPHDHNIGLTIPPFLFNVVTAGIGNATQNHAHQVNFAPVELDFTSGNDLRNYFLHTSNVFLSQPDVTSTTTVNHSHTIAAGTIPFDTVTTFTYDVSSSLVRVHNRNPETLAVNLPTSSIENSTVQLTGSFADVGTGDTHRVLVNWGDGTSGEVSVAFGEHTFSADHEYADDNPTGTASDNYTVTATVVDDDGGSATTSRVITLLNELPSLALALNGAVNEGTSFNLAGAAFSDRGRLDTHTATINWGDGQNSTGIVTEAGGTGIVNASHVFTDEGNYVVRVTVRDDDTGEAVRTMDVAVANVPPSITRLWADGPSLEGTSLTLRATAIDPGADTLTYHWDFGDGSSPAVGVNLNSAAHAFADPGTYTVTLVVDDGDGGSSTQSITIVVADLSTAASISGATEVAEGASYTLTLSAFTPAAATAITNWLIDWGDGGSSTSATDGSVNHTYADGPANHVIRVDVAKSTGGTALIGTIPISVLNVTPVITSLVGDSTGSEGQSRQFTGAASDPGADVLTYSWDFGDGSPVTSGINQTGVQHAFADDGAYVVTLMVSDSDGATTSRQFPVVIANVVPSISLAGAVQTVEGTPYDLTLQNVFDPGTDTVIQWIVDWGDGRTDSYGAGGVVTHAFADGPGNYTIRVSLTDEDGVHRNLAQRAVVVLNAPPEVHAIMVDAVAFEGSVADFSSDVSDPAGPYDLLTYRWNFGDGSPVVQGVNLASARHTYVDNGTYQVTLQVSDEDGDSSSKVLALQVANVSPITVLSGQSTAIEGQLYAATPGPIVDPGNDTVIQWIIDWGDGQQEFHNTPDTATHTFADGPAVHEVVLSLVDEDGEHLDRASLHVSVANSPPIIESLTGADSGFEGGTFHFVVPATDVVADELSYAWDFGDGTSMVTGAELAEIDHIYADDGIYLLTVVVNDEDGGNDSQSLLVTVDNVIPTIAITAASTANENQPFELSLSTPLDPGDDVVSDWTVDWGDGSIDQLVQVGLLSHTYADGPATHTIRVSLVDDDGLYLDAAVQQVDVINSPPQINAVTVAPSPREGQSISFEIDASDAAAELDPLSYTWDFGDASPLITTSAPNSQHVYADDGSYVVSVKADDGDGGQASYELQVVIGNVAPTIQLSGFASTPEGIAYDLTLGAITDPGQDTVSQWMVDWGNGIPENFSAGGVVSHIYPDGPATATLRVWLTDEDGTYLAGEKLVSVRNTSPEVVSLGGDIIGDEGDELSFVATAIDAAGAVDPLTYTWNFDDGTPPIYGTDLTSVSHVFADDGDRAVQVTISDGDGASVAEFIAVHLHNVDPQFDAGSDELLLPPVVGAFSRLGINFTDPGQDIWHGTVNYQDGTGDQQLDIDQQTKTFDLNHIFAISGTFDVVVTVHDDDDGSLTDSFQVEVILNTPPVANDDEVVTDEDHAVTFDTLVNDMDEQNNIVPPQTTLVTPPSRGTVIEDGSGVFTYSPAGDFDFLGVGEADEEIMVYQIEDSFGESDTAMVSITILGLNDPPSVDILHSETTVDEGSMAFNSGNFADVDSSDNILITASIGTIAQDSGHAGHWYWSWDVADGPTDSQVVTIRAEDGQGSVATTSFQVQVDNVPPTLAVVGTQSVDQALPLTLSDLGTFTDPGRRNVAAGTDEFLSYMIDWGDESNSAGAATVDTVGSPGVPTAGSFDGVHTYALPGIYTVTVMVADDDGGSDTGSFQVHVDSSIVVLNSSASKSLSISGDAVIDFRGSVLVNSSHLQAMSASGHAEISADSVRVVGGVELSGNVVVNPTPTIGATPVLDPLMGLPIPGDAQARGNVDCHGQSSLVLLPGVYGDLKASGNCQLIFSPGMFVIKGGELKVSGSAVLTGMGVTIYHAGSNFPSPGGNFKEIHFSGNAIADLTAPSSGPYRGVVLFQARDNSRPISLSGNFEGLAGTIYAPAAQVDLSGNIEAQVSLVVDRLKMSGHTNILEVPVAQVVVPVSLLASFASFPNVAVVQPRSKQLINATRPPSQVMPQSPMPTNFYKPPSVTPSHLDIQLVDLVFAEAFEIGDIFQVLL